MKNEVIVLQGELELLSAALIGSGQDEFSNADVIIDGQGKPFIPATSLVGVLRRHIKPECYMDFCDEFWGYMKNNFKKEEADGLSASKTKQKQSALSCSDLVCKNEAKIVTRDGIRIDGKNGMVAATNEEQGNTKTGAKFDYQVIEPGDIFQLHLEVAIADGLSVEQVSFYKKMVATIRESLEQGKIRIGAHTNNGLGKVRLQNAHIRHFDFTIKNDVWHWLKSDYSTCSSMSEEPFRLEKNTFRIDAVFNLKTSFISRAYSEDPGLPDAVSIKSGDRFVITGSSFKGAIRARAERILNTIGKEEKTATLLKELFGHVDVEKKQEETRKGRIRIEETFLPDYPTEIQTRIKIDRFTGGTIEGALFETMPLFNGKEENKFSVSLEIDDYKEYEAGLLLLVLKDLWTGDLAVGGEKNVGRGVLQGVCAEISWTDSTGEKQVGSIKREGPEKNKLFFNNREGLEKLVRNLTEFLGGNQ